MEIKTSEKVSTSEDVKRIFIANRRVVSLAAAWLKAMKVNDQITAMRIRREQNRIKNEILADYDIIL